jgi:hypothetical protein
MTAWFLILGLPTLAAGLFALVFSTRAGDLCRTFPRNVLAGWILCAVGWILTAYECHTIGIDVFDKFLKAFPMELPILAIVLTILTCWWMPNLLPIRGVCALFMLFPAEMFPVIRLCDTQWRLALVVFAYACIVVGMYGMFYPWRIRQVLAWLASSPARVRAVGAICTAVGGLFVALSACGLT